MAQGVLARHKDFPQHMEVAAENSQLKVPADHAGSSLEF
jgi:hypothetical protein